MQTFVPVRLKTHAICQGDLWAKKKGTDKVADERENSCGETGYQLEHEHNQRRVPYSHRKPFDSVQRRRRVGFEDLVLPSSQSCFDAVESGEETRDDGLEGKTLFVNIGSGDEAEDEAEEEKGKAKKVDGNELQGPSNCARCGSLSLTKWCRVRELLGVLFRREVP